MSCISRSPNWRTKHICRYAARESMVIPCGMESPFSFPLVEKKTAIHGQKKRRLGMSCPRNSQLTHTKERPVRTADKIQKSPTGCADRYSSNNCVPASVGAAFIGVQRGHPLPPFPLPLPLSLEGFPKGRAAARPFVSFQGGAGGNRNPPAFLFRGPGGTFSFQKRISPWLLRTEPVQFRREPR